MHTHNSTTTRDFQMTKHQNLDDGGKDFLWNQDNFCTNTFYFCVCNLINLLVWIFRYVRIKIQTKPFTNFQPIGFDFESIQKHI